MALTVVLPGPTQLDQAGLNSSAKFVTARITGDSAYLPASGYAVTPGTFGLSQVILGILPNVTVNALTSQGNTAWYDPSGKAIHFMVPGATAVTETATGTNLSATSLDIIVVGY